jgi:hypothetical protein
MIDNRNNLRNKLILLALLAVLGIGLVVFLFSASGLFMRWWNIDLNFLTAPLLICFLLLILSALIPHILVPQYCRLFSTLIKYSAISLFTFWVLHRAPLFSRLPFLSQHLDILSIFKEAALSVAFFWVGLGIYQLSTLLTQNKVGRPAYQPLFLMLGFLVIGFSLWKCLDIFSLYWSPLRGTGLVVGLSLIIVSLTRLAAYITTPLTFLIGEALKWSLEYPAKLFWLSILILLYFVFARPMIYSISAYAYLIEWILVCFTGYQILSLIKNNLKTHHSQPLQEKDWRKHQQMVNKIADEDFNKMITLQEEFIQSGIRRNLLLFLRQLLMNNGIQDAQINQSLQPVIEYNDARTRWYNRWFFKERLSQGNRYRRSLVLEDSMDRIRGIIYPSRKYINGETHERNPVS